MKKAIIYLMMSIVLLAILSCSKSNPVSLPQLNHNAISFHEDKLPLSGEEFTYRQEVEINGEKSGNSYAYKVSTVSGNPPAGYAVDAEGWLLFDSVNAGNIWTSKPKLGFEFDSVNGKVQDLIKHIEVKIKTPNNEINQYSSAFKSSRIIGSMIYVNFAQGAQVGTGVQFELSEVIGDIFVEGLYAGHFMYRLNIVDANLNAITEGQWYSSLEMADIRKVKLNGFSTPALVANAEGQYTQFETYVVTRHGIEEAQTSSVYFRAVSGYLPKAMIYPQTLAGLGQYHYSITGIYEGNAADLIPSNSEQKSRNLWFSQNQYMAINSPDFKLHVRWGYRGQYGIITQTSWMPTDNPWDSEINMCISDNGQYYGSRIVAFDLRLNGQPFPIQPEFFNPQIVTHADNSQWLRIPNHDDANRHTILQNLSSGTHTMEVCVVDLQGLHDATPVSISINLSPYVPFANRSGVLIVDDSASHTTFSPEDYVDTFYNSVVPTTWGPVDSFDVSENGIGSISPSMLMNYKAVLWHSDNPSSSSNLPVAIDALDIYTGNAGNLIISGTHHLLGVFSSLLNSVPSFYTNRLGLTSNSQYGYLATAIQTNTFMQKAIGLGNLNDIHVRYYDEADPGNYPETGFNSIVNARKGIGTLTYFNPDSGLNFLYGFGCKPVTYPTFPPTQAQYDLYSDTYLAYKHTSGASSVVIFGFPLSYMRQSEVASALQTIFAGILNNSYAGGK